MLSKNKTSHKERGAAHLLLILVFVVALIGVLGYLGYNAWQRQNANAGGEDSLGTAQMPSDTVLGPVLESNVDTVSGDTVSKSMVAKTTSVPKECEPVQPPYLWAHLKAIPSRSLGKNRVVLETLGENTYRVYGYTRAQVREQIKTCAPKGDNGPYVYGRYMSPVSAAWTLDYNSAKNECRVTAFSVGARTGRISPRYTASSKAADGLNETMAAYIAAIKQSNADSHQLIGKVLADFRKSVVGYKRDGSCMQLANYLNGTERGEKFTRLWAPMHKMFANEQKNVKKVKLSDY